MDSLADGMTVAALIFNGVLAGLSLDKVVVQLPARRRLGVVEYARYARAADLANGVIFYTFIGVSAAISTIAAAGAVFLRSGTSQTVETLLGIAAALSIAHSAATGLAAPTMFRIGQAEDAEVKLGPLLTRFTRVSTARAIFQVTTFLVVVAAVIVSR